MRQVDEDNLSTDVVLGRGKVSKLKDLLASHEWAEPWLGYFTDGGVQPPDGSPGGEDAMGKE